MVSGKCQAQAGPQGALELSPYPHPGGSEWVSGPSWLRKACGQGKEAHFQASWFREAGAGCQRGSPQTEKGVPGDLLEDGSIRYSERGLLRTSQHALGDPVRARPGCHGSRAVCLWCGHPAQAASLLSGSQMCVERMNQFAYRLNRVHCGPRWLSEVSLCLAGCSKWPKARRMLALQVQVQCLVLPAWEHPPPPEGPLGAPQCHCASVWPLQFH